MDLLNSIVDTISKHNLLEPGDRVLVAVSGGPDSCALLDLLYRFAQEHFSIELTIACLDHGLWPEAREDQNRLVRLSKKYSLPLLWKKIDLLAEGNSAIEKRGRQQRYQFLQEAATEAHATKVAVAHHHNDQAETFLFRMLKGAGVYGLSGIPYHRQITPGSPIKLIRPLLDIAKKNIIEYLDQNHLEWWDDQSNYDTRFTRSHLRYRIFPFLEKEGYPYVSESFCRIAAHCRELSLYLEKQAQQYLFCAGLPAHRDAGLWLEQILGNIVIAIEEQEWQRIENVLLPYVLRNIYHKLGIAEKLLRQKHYLLLQNLVATNQKFIQLPNNVQVYRLSGKIYFMRMDTDLSISEESFTIPGDIAISDHCRLKGKFAEKYRQPSSLLEAWLDSENLELPLKVRFWQRGERIHPLGASGKRKISRILADLKIAQPLRKYFLLISDRQNRPLWIPGVCIDHRHRIGETTKNIIQLSIGEENAGN